jgi:uncharacterized protein with PQ loop repeat
MRATDPRHHLHIRKRIHVRHEQYPHPEFLKRMLDRVIYLVGFFGPISTLPQVYTIYAYHNAAGVSVFTWTTLAFFSIIWITYGIVHKEKVIVFTYCLWFVMNSLVAVGAALYQ